MDKAIDTIQHNSVLYRLYEGKSYYACGSSDTKRLNESMLHRQVWIDANGDIPNGYCVHHMDKDTRNNNISNLELKEKSTHQREHVIERMQEGGDLHNKLKAFRESERGKAILKDNARKMHKNTLEKEYKCDVCKIIYSTKIYNQKYCSPECAKIAGRKGKKEKICPICGIVFYVKVNTKKETQTCGTKCGWVLRRHLK